MSLHVLSNTYVSPETAFSANNKSVRTRSLSLFVAALVMTLTLVLVSSIACVDVLSTFANSFSVLVAYALSVLCWRILTKLTLAIRTFASALTRTLLKNNFVKVREHASRS